MDYSERKKVAQSLVTEDKYPDALREYVLLFKEDPKDEECLNAILFLFGRIVDGNYDFEPTTSDEFVMRGVSKFYQGEFESSIEDYNQALLIEPDNDYAHKSKSFSLRFIGQSDEAIVELEVAISINPVGDYFDNLAELYDLLGETRLAFENYQKAIIASPDDCRLWYNFGVHLMEKQDLNGALEKFDKAIELWPLYDDAIHNKNWIIQNS